MPFRPYMYITEYVCIEIGSVVKISSRKTIQRDTGLLTSCGIELHASFYHHRHHMQTLCHKNG